MKLAASQIAWELEQQEQALKLLQQYGYKGLEIAPTMVAGAEPYRNIEIGKQFAKKIQIEYGLFICSMQSIWYGQSGSMFGVERENLLEYTKQAILFAEEVGAKNLVFGSPKNRVLPTGVSVQSGVDFFKKLGDFAKEKHTVLSLEANPPMYGTNFMNTTKQALDIVGQVGSQGCKLNLDFGTIIMNNENIADLKGMVTAINHVHISEPELAVIQPRQMHKELAALLKEEGYTGYISIEMRKQPLDIVERCIAYVAEVFR